ncbi:MAG: hypothetical protein AAFX06_01395 [Planctomycetota bacterium]
MAMRTDQPDHRPIRRLLVRLIKAPAAWSLVWPLALIFGTYIALNRWGWEFLAERYGKLDPQRVSVSEPHRYVRSDIVSEVYQDTGLERLSPLDRQATAKLASAFASHPWVRRVHRVHKLPGGGVDVQLEYREPVAAFHLTGDWEWFQNLEFPPADVDDDQYFALDAEGVLLPTRDLTVDDMDRLIQIEVWEKYPFGDEGTPFGDRGIESAALLAGLLSKVSDQIRISKITLSGDSRLNVIPQLHITTANNIHVFWGSPPGMEQPNERSAREKLEDLVRGNFANETDLTIGDRRTTAPIYSR